MPGANLVIGQPDLLLGDFEAFFDRPALASDPRESGEAGLGRAEDDVVGEIGGVAPAASDQQPMLPGRLLQSGQPQAGPVIEPLPFAAGAGREPLPGILGQSLRQLRRGVLPEAPAELRPQLLIAADGEHEGLLAALQIHPETAIGAVNSSPSTQAQGRPASRARPIIPAAKAGLVAKSPSSGMAAAARLSASSHHSLGR